MKNKQIFIICLTLIFVALLVGCGSQPPPTVDTSAIDAANAAAADAEAKASAAEEALAEAEAAAKEAADAEAEELAAAQAAAEAAQAEAETAQAEAEAAQAAAEAAQAEAAEAASAQAEAEASQAEAEASQAEAEAEPEKTKIVWLACCGWPSDVVEAEFEKQNPDIDLEVENVGFNELFQQIQIRLGAEDDTPDVLAVDGPVVASYGLRGWLLPLDDVFSQREINDWLDASYEAGHFEGELIAAPLSTSTQLLFYNKTLLEEAGVTPPGQDDRWTWEEIAAAAQQVKAANPDVQGFNWEQMVRIYQLQPLPMSLGGEAIGEDALTVRGVIDSQEWIDAFTFYWKVYNEWELAPQGEVYGAGDVFVAGDLALVVAGPWNIPRFSEEIDFEWGVSRHPYFEGGTIAIPTGSWHMGVNKNTSHPDEAARFVQWLTTGEGAEMWWRDGSGDFPAQKSVLELFQTEPEFDEGKPLAAMRIAADEAGVSPVPRPVTVGYLEYEQILQDTFQDIRNGTDPEEALTTAVDRIEREMQKYE